MIVWLQIWSGHEGGDEDGALRCCEEKVLMAIEDPILCLSDLWKQIFTMILQKTILCVLNVSIKIFQAISYPL